MDVLITGGTGYIGSHVALDLAARGHRVTAVARAPARGSTSAARAEQLRAAGVTLAHADLGRRGELAAAVDPAGVEVIVHGVCSFLEPAAGESLTLVAMDEMLALAARCPRLAQAIDLSNNLVLAPPAPGETPDETFPCRPETAHGRNKLAAERRLERSGRPWVTLRIPQVYGGVGSSFDWVMVDPIRTGTFPVPCDGHNRVSLVHVDDVVQAVRLVLDKGVRDRVFNVASGERDLTLGEVFDAVARGFGLPPPRRLPRLAALLFMGGAERWARLRGKEPTLVADMVRVLAENRTLSIARARDELGFTPRFPDTLQGIASSYADVFAGRAQAFNPAGRLAAAQGRGHVHP
jgi:nucleoside-diphosphate-sugar epimerase